jgi:type IV secretion system protein VirD4
METSDFSFDELCGGNISVYLVLPPDKLETYARWLRLMVSIGIRAVARGGSQGRLPALFVLDEFGTIGKLNAVAKAYGLMAGLGMIMWAFAQDLNQLKRDYPDHWETFIGNSQAVTCFGVMDNFTADYISKMLGTRRSSRRMSRLRRQVGRASPAKRADLGFENVILDFDQLFETDPEPTAHASRRGARFRPE